MHLIQPPGCVGPLMYRKTWTLVRNISSLSTGKLASPTCEISDVCKDWMTCEKHFPH
ncbi:unnamed protein product [Staurois parvus]|uniref:Uncharacterized protein n=1 Tax=Staurois parvus TaxID=386267 RepID=A0ABN9AWM6_9NEOB|nr:unnamed protein product [Staurois parvus]